MSNTAPPPDVRPPPGDVPTAGTTSTTGRSLRCRACGYDLRGTSPSDNCPECGTPVARTLAGDGLGAADPDWVKRIALGLWLDVGGTALSFLLSFPNIAAILYGPAEGVGGTNVRAWIVYLAAAGLTWAGTWYVTAPEPGVWSGPAGEPLRLGLRWGATAETLFRTFGPQGYRPGVPSSELVAFGMVSVGLVLTVMWWALAASCCASHNRDSRSQPSSPPSRLPSPSWWRSGCRG